MSEEPVRYEYGWSWHEDDRTPVDPMDEDAARAAYADGPQLGVSALDGPPGSVPAYSLELSAGAADVRVVHYDEHGSIVEELDWSTVDGRLFLEEAAAYTPPDDGTFHSTATSTRMRTWFFRADGSASVSTTTADGTEVEQVGGLDLAEHWLDPVAWGEWDRIGEHRVRLPGGDPS